MIWLTWRQHRAEGFVVLGVLAVSSIFLLLSGRTIADMFQQSGLSACLAQHPADASACGALGALFLQQYGGLIPFAAALLIEPFLLGAIVGAPLLAREYEQRTHLLAWMQSITRTRWLTVKFVVILGAGALVGGALLALLLWWYSPFAQLIGSFNFVAYDFSGPVLIAAAVMALALGIFAGTVTRRTVSAIFLTLGLLVALHVLVEFNLRPNFEPQIVVTWSFDQGPNPPVTLGIQDWDLGNGWLDPQGNRTNGIRCISAQPEDPIQCAKDEGYRGYYLAYQPADRFWTFQWIETSIYLALSVLAVGATFWLVRRRIG